MKQSKIDLVNLILGDKDSKLEEEEMLHLLLEKKFSKNINMVNQEGFSMGDKMADYIARFAGSWGFILIFTACLIGWVVVNIMLLSKPFDPYPFILLNLILSCVAAIQAPVIMMSQNRQDEKDRLRAQNDYKINLKSEIIIEDLHEKLDMLIENQNKILNILNKKGGE